MPRMNTKDLVWEIRKWWNDRIVDGCQLANADEATAGFDYVGKDRWKRRVSVDALRRDFMIERNMDVTVAAFGTAFRKATNQDDIIVRRFSLDAPRGKYRRPITYVRFGKPPLTPLPL